MLVGNVATASTVFHDGFGECFIRSIEIEIWKEELAPMLVEEFDQRLKHVGKSLEPLIGMLHARMLLIEGDTHIEITTNRA